MVDAGVPVIRVERELRLQARACEALGSPLYGHLLSRAAEDFEAGGPTFAVLRGHDGEGSALALRLMGAVHRLVLRGEAPALATLYADPDRDPALAWSAFAELLAGRREDLRELVRLPVQTNEVGRCAALLPGFLAVAAGTGLPLRILELGASAGLNLRWDRYRYELDGFRWGPAGSPLTISAELRGRPPTAVGASVAERRGCDPSPIAATTAAGRETLLAYPWADQPHRRHRAEAALDLARQTPAAVDRSPAGPWLRERLCEAVDGVATVAFHSIVMQYVPSPERAAIAAMLREAGEAADPRAPLAWLRMEPAGERADLRLTVWPSGEEIHLGRAGYHGDPVELL
jgi:hypothetical protein